MRRYRPTLARRFLIRASSRGRLASTYNPAWNSSLRWPHPFDVGFLVDGVQDLFGAADIRGGNVREGEAQSRALEGDAHLVDLLRLVGRQGGHQHAAPGQEFHETLGFELPKSLADGDPTYAQLCSNLILPQLVPSLEQPAEDRLAHHLGHQLRGTPIPLGHKRSNAGEVHGGYSYTICKYTVPSFKPRTLQGGTGPVQMTTGS